MKNFLRCLLLVLSLTVGLQYNAEASHAKGADITYVNVGEDSFIVVLNFYRDCFGIDAPTAATVQVSSISCGFTGSITLPLTSTIQPQNIPNGSEVSALCGAALQNSTCNGGNLPGVQQYQYSALVVLPSKCVDWVFSYDIGSRNAAITNLVDPDLEDMYVEATLNSTIFPQNSAPTFTNRPVPYFCYLDSIQYNQGAVDIDGDSLVYTLINAMGAGGTPIAYVSPFSPTYPLATTSGVFGFDTQTGQMSFVPSQGQIAVVTVLVQEYRNGVFVGSTIRDIQFNILGNPICVPPYGQVRSAGIETGSVTGGQDLGNFTLQVCPGNTLTFDIAFGGDSVYLSSNASLALPGATFTVTRLGTDSVRGHFSWVPSALDTGTRVFSIDYGIRSCPIDRTSSRTITINVLKGTSAGPDRIYCTAGQPIQLYAVGGNNFTWSPAAGLSSTTIRNPLASPTVTTNYIVTSDLAGQCGNKDTVQVKVVPNFILSISPQNGNINLCRNSLVGLSVVADTTYGPYTYSWTPGNGLVDSAGRSDSTSSSVFARPLVNTTYAVYVTSDTGCTIKDSVNINLTNSGPKVVVSSSRTQACAGDTIQLTSSVFPVSCGAASGGGSCSGTNPPIAKAFGTGSLTSVVSPFGGSKPVYRMQSLYRKADLIAAGLNSGTVVRLRFDVIAKNSSRVYKNFTIRLGCTSTDQLSRNNWETVSTQVYFAASQQINAGLNTFTLNQPYDWDGYSNIVMEVCFGDTTLSAGGDDNVSSTATTYNASMSASVTTSTAGCTLGANLIAANQPIKQLPNITFFFCAASNPAYTYAWTPASGLSSTTISNPIATVTQPVTYFLNVTDANCTGTDLIKLIPDSATLTLSNDTSLCSLAAGDSLQLHLVVGGTPIAQCGNNGNACTGPLNETKVGTGTVENFDDEYPAPFGNYYGSAMQQYLYSAADLLAAGVRPGRVKELAFYVNDLGFTTNQYLAYTISEKCTNVPALTVGTPETGLTTVYNARTVTPVTGINNFVLDNAFDWDGVSNVVLQICFNNTSVQPFPFSANAISPSTSTGYLSSTSYLDDDVSQCTPTSQPLVTDGGFFRPNTRFRVCDAQGPSNVTWTPSTGINNIHSLDPKVHPAVTTTYKVTVVTPLGCIKTDSVTVRIGNAVVHTISRDTSICVGGSVPLLVTGGTTYAWTPTTGLSCTTCPNPIASPTVTTRYRVSITDNVSGCTITDSVRVTVVAGPRPPFGNDTSICFTDSVILHAGGGFVTYNWSVPNGNDSNLVVRTGGTYSVTITSAGGCTVSDTITINSRALPIVNLGNDTIACQGNTITLDAGAGYTTYAWTPTAATQTIPVTTTNNYSVTVTDANGCKSADTIRVTFNPVPVVTLGNDTTLCNADTLRLSANNGPNFTYLWSNGTTDSILLVTSALVQPVSVTVSGGGALCTVSDAISVTFRAPVAVFIGNDTAVCQGQTVTFDAGPGFSSYLWSTGPPQITRSITVGTAGTYKVVVTDNIGCRGMDSAVLTINTTPVVITGADTICQGGRVTLTATIAVPAGASYLWSTGETTASITVDTSARYCVTVTPATGCPGFACDTVAVIAPPTVNLGNDTLVCAGATVTLSAGTQPAGTTYLWDNNTTAATRTVNFGGTYFVDVTNAGGCTTRDSIVVTYRPAAFIDAGNDTTVCAGQFVTFTATPPVGFVNYTWYYFGNGSTTIPGNTVTSNNPGVYAIHGTDINGCVAIDTVLLANINASVNIGPDSTKICSSDSIRLDAGAGYTSYVWSTGENTQTINVNGNEAGNVKVTVTDPNGCVASDSIVVGVNPAAAPNLGNDTTLCPNTPFTLYPGAFDAYTWSDGSHNSTLTIDAAATYTVQVTDSNGCKGSDAIVIGYYPAPATLTPFNDTLCRNATDTLRGPAGYSAYLWSNGSTADSLLVTVPGNYTLTATDANGCTASVTNVISDGTFTVNPSADPTPVNAGQSAALNANVIGGGNFNYLWTPGASLNDSTARTPVAKPLTTTTYTVLVTNTTSGCFETDTVTVTVFNSSLFVFPEAFTPNGDGHNDFFGPITSGSNIVVKEFRIYNRFGSLVHSAPTPWNGEVSGSAQPADTYVYTVEMEITDATGTRTEHMSGAFTLIR